ncbi:Vacuolar cation-transporting ATPase YPK9 [Dictyocoela roeselum]|nr:Vacuolar cation-transporting ATPase YPK9 [Dictyocoela roeselum]
MFEYSGSTLNGRVVNVEGVGIVEILKYNEFTSLRRLMSVVICEGRKRYLFAKGSPEAILGTLANAPPQYHDVVNYYALEGFRVIAMAYKCLVGKDEGETNLNFLGFLVFSNQLKPTTKNVIADLRAANLNCKMATGDGILTAISVATQCGLLDRESPVIFPKLSPSAQSLNDIDWMCIGDHDLYFDKVRLALISEEDGIDVDFAIACEGAIYEKIREESEQYHNFILSKGIVFARMSPEQKKHLVEDLQTTKTTVCFCGDGANDSSALTAANVGISLNVGQQYFAGFTSKVKNIECVVHIIREGRAALVASISNFRLQILISIIQLFSCSLLSCLFLFPSEAQTCHYDLLFAFISAYVLSSFKTSTTLHREQPKIDILSKAFLVPLGGHLLIDLIFAMGIFIYVREPTTSHVFRKESATVTVSFFITIIQGIMGFCIFTEGLPHRESKYKNPKFITFIVPHVSFLILILLGSTYIDAVSKFYSFVWKSMSQRIFVVVYGMLNALVLLLFHGFIDRAGNDLFCKKSKIQRKTEKYEEFL